MVTVTTAGVGEEAVEAGRLSVVVTTVVSEPPPTVIVTTDTTGANVDATPVTVTALVTIVSEIVIVITETVDVAVSDCPTVSTGFVTTAAVSVGDNELRDANTDEEMAGASVTGHTVVVTSTTVVISTVVTPSGSEVGSEIAAPVPEVAGQLVTVDAHEMMVIIEVADTVRVVKLAPTAAIVVFANGAMMPDDILLVIVALFAELLVTVAGEVAVHQLEWRSSESFECRPYHLLRHPRPRKTWH
jgi:hypothetical protein